MSHVLLFRVGKTHYLILSKLEFSLEFQDTKKPGDLEEYYYAAPLFFHTVLNKTQILLQ